MNQADEILNAIMNPEVFIANEVVKVKALRVQIDACIQAVRELSGSAERTLSMRKLQEAVMWLGMDLKRLGETNPYPNSRDTTNAIVDPTADGLKL
jgi:hypothetical protein